MKIFVNGEEKKYRVIADNGKRIEELTLGDEVELFDFEEKPKPFYKPIRARVIGVDKETLYCKVGR